MEHIHKETTASGLPVLVSVKDITAWLGVDRQTVDAMIKDGRLPPPLPTGLRKRTWTAADIMAWIEMRRQASGCGSKS